MTITTKTVEPGIVSVTVDYPPVNAIPSRGWFELADAITAAGRDTDTHVVILRAEGRGFNAGVDIKEMQNTEGFTALIDANRGCFHAFRAVYECEVPVVAAVNGFCVGGGIGLVGNSDVIVASDDATFGLPEVERGALGAATHLVPAGAAAHDAPAVLHRRRPSTPQTLHHFGSVHEVVPRAELDEAALRRRPRHRGQGHPGDPRRQGGAQRHRRPAASTPATAWSRASPSSSTWPASPTSTATRSREPATRRDPGKANDGEQARQEDDARRGRRVDRERHDHRHRRLGFAAQADGASSARCCAPTSPTSPSSPTAAPTSGCCARRARSSASTTASCPWTRRRSTTRGSRRPAPPARSRPARWTRACSMRPAGRRRTAAVPADPRRPRLRRADLLGRRTARPSPPPTPTRPAALEELIAMPALNLDAALRAPESR